MIGQILYEHIASRAAQTGAYAYTFLGPRTPFLLLLAFGDQFLAYVGRACSAATEKSSTATVKANLTLTSGNSDPPSYGTR